MRQAGLSGLIPKKHGRTTVRVPGVRVADDLVKRQFRPDAPKILWIADIAYLRTWERWLYLSAVQDAYSRRIVGWSMADHMRTALVVDALTMAVWAPPVDRRPRRPTCQTEMPGAARDGAARFGGRAATAQQRRLELREVKVNDPNLSEEVNRRLTDELRQALGRDRVWVPADRPDPGRGEIPRRDQFVAFLEERRFLLARFGLFLLVIGAILALTAGSWWFFGVAVGLDVVAAATMAVATLQLTTLAERPSPTTVALLEDEGVPDPEHYFSRLVAAFSEGRLRGAADVLAPGENVRTAPAYEDPARATIEQESAMTPTSEPSAPGGERGLPAIVEWAIILGLVVVSISVPLGLGGGDLWLMTAVIVPCAVGWTMLQWLLSRTDDTGPPLVQGPWLSVAVVVVTALVVAAGCVVIALAIHNRVVPSRGQPLNATYRGQ
jgi:hypothetical protein